MIKDYYSLTKPGIIFGNLVTVCGGFFLAARGNIHFTIFISVLLGLSLIVASGCVFNNFIDRDIDRLMERTKNRPLVRGVISGKNAIIFAIILGLMGTGILWIGTNRLTVGVSLFGLLVYVVVYSLWLKRNSVYGTIIGSISGSIPPVAGYCSVANCLDSGALILFLILGFWQIPHSYAIAIYRLKDYTAAGIPVLPVKKGVYTAKIHMLVYVLLFVAATMMLTIFNYTGFIYLFIASTLGIYWILLVIKGFWTKDNKKWARRVFLFSIIIIMTLSISMSINYVIPK